MGLSSGQSTSGRSTASKSTVSLLQWINNSSGILDRMCCMSSYQRDEIMREAGLEDDEYMDDNSVVWNSMEVSTRKRRAMEEHSPSTPLHRSIKSVVSDSTVTTVLTQNTRSPSHSANSDASHNNNLNESYCPSDSRACPEAPDYFRAHSTGHQKFEREQDLPHFILEGENSRRRRMVREISLETDSRATSSLMKRMQSETTLLHTTPSKPGFD